MLSELALAVWVQEGIDGRFNHLATTSVSLPGDAVPEADEQARTITPGSSQDHRPDLKQAVLERMVAQAGGVPCGSNSWEGHASATPIVQARAAALMVTLPRPPTPRSLVADATLYHADHAANLSQLGCITRIPNTLTLVSQVITHALTWDRWPWLDDTPRAQRVE